MPQDYRSYTGPELRGKLDELGAKVEDVAREMGRSRTTVWRMTRSAAVVPYLRAKDYLDALDRLAAKAA